MHIQIQKHIVKRCKMDYPYAKSIKDMYRASNRGLSPDRLDATRKSLGATQREESNDYGFGRLNGGYNWEASRRDEYGMSRRDAAEDWDSYGATMRDDSGNPRRDNLGRTTRENLGATRRMDLGVTRTTRHEDFGASDADDIRATGGNPYRNRRSYRQLQDRENYGASRAQVSYSSVKPYGYVVQERNYSGNSEQATPTEKTRRWTRADRVLNQDFGQMRTKRVSTSGLDDPTSFTQRFNGKSRKYVDGGRRSKRSIIVVGVVAMVLLMAVTVPTLVLTHGSDTEKEVLVQYEFKARVTKREYSADMADRNSRAFKNVENEFCNQLDQNAVNTSKTDFTFEGCSVKEIKDGSLIIIYIIVIKTSRSRDQALPTAQQVSSSVGIVVTASKEQDVGVFKIDAVEITIAQPIAISESQNPVKTKVQFNGTCSGSNKGRCATKHSECIDGVCKCPVDRTHDDSSDICNQIDCGDVPIISNGTVTSNGTRYRSALTIECDEGFKLDENATVYCTTPGTWGELPLCMLVECPQFITPNNSEVVANTTGRRYTDSIEITCIKGYKLDSNSSAVTCLANGQWSEFPSCEIINCGPLVSADETYTVENSSTSTYNTSLLVTCVDGLELTYISMKYITCDADGQWIGHIECKIPVNLEGLQYKIVTKANNESWHFDGNNPNVTAVSSRFQVDDDFVKFMFEKQVDETYKIKSVAKLIYMYDGYNVTGAPAQYLHGNVNNATDDDHMRFIVSVVETMPDYYTIKTKATGRYVRLDEDEYVSSRENKMDDRSIFKSVEA